MSNFSTLCASKVTETSSPDAHLQISNLPTNFAWAFAGNVFYAASQWAVFVVVSRLGNPEMVGHFALALAVTGPIMVFSQLQLRALQSTDAKREFQFGHCFALRLAMTGLAVASVAAIAVSGRYSTQIRYLIILVAFAKAFESLSDIFYGLFQREERMDWVGKSMIMRGPLSLLAMAVFLYATKSVLWGAVGMLSVWAFIFGRFDVRRGILLLKQTSCQPNPPIALRRLEHASPLWEYTALQRLFRLSSPLGLAMMLVSLITNVPRYMIALHLGHGALGIFSAITSLQTSGGFVMNALTQSSAARIATCHQTQDVRGFKVITLRLLAMAIVLGCLGVLFAAVAGKLLLRILYGATYAEHVDVLVWTMVGALALYLTYPLNCIMTTLRLTLSQVPLVACAVVATFLSCLFLVPRMGLRGAAMSLAIGNMTQVLASTLAVAVALHNRRRRPRLPYNA
jgi:O-antigen/teichoic acid export membrane protein